MVEAFPDMRIASLRIHHALDAKPVPSKERGAEEQWDFQNRRNGLWGWVVSHFPASYLTPQKEHC
jgi:hypothetical protein